MIYMILYYMKEEFQNHLILKHYLLMKNLLFNGLLMKKSMEKCPKTLETIKYEPNYALRGAARDAAVGWLHCCLQLRSEAVGPAQRWAVARL